MSGAVEKRNNDFVSSVDLAAEDAALSIIRGRHPTHGVLAEESATLTSEAAGSDSAPLWIVDPLDGTTNFLHTHPMFASSVAVCLGGEATAGAVTAAATDERWWGAVGLGAWRARDSAEPARITTSSTDELHSALVGTGFPFKAPELLELYLSQLGRVLRNTSGVRRGGAAAIDLCYLAEGRLDAFWELKLNPWDVAAGAVILREAGGIVSRLDGSALTMDSGSVLGANGCVLHRALGELVRAETGGR